MGGLSLETPKITTTAAPKQKKQPVLDSWEDESSESEHEPPTPTNTTTNNNNSSSSTSNTPIDPHRLSGSNFGLGSGFSAPPPTPASPSYKADNMPWQQQQQSIATVSEEVGGGGDEKRPEKTDAVARRMIASALGVRTLRPNEEQRAYDRAVREKERKRREEEREAERRRQEEAERAKAAIWND